VRLVNRLLAALLALAIVVVGVLVVIEVIADRLNDRPAIVHWQHAYEWAHRTEWQSGSVRVTFIVAAVLGLILLLLELKPRRPSRMRIDSDQTDAAYTRRGVAASVHAAVTDVDGISRAAVRVRRHRIRVAATTAGVAPYTADALREPATQAAQARLEELQLKPVPSLAVRVTTRSR
jgi:Family of unknown function (DUF6286)